MSGRRNGSYIDPQKVECYDFLPGVGFHKPCDELKSLSSMISSNVHKFHGNNFHVPNISNNHIYVQEQTKQLKFYKHGFLNVDITVRDKIDQFCQSVELCANPACFEVIIGKKSCRLSSFQVMMSLHLVFTMMIRYGIFKYATSIMLYIKDILQLKYLTPSFIKDVLLQSFSKVTCVSVQRRMGKSITVYANIARALAFFPFANCKILYVIHTRRGLTQCYSTLLQLVPQLLVQYNTRQYELFTRRLEKCADELDKNNISYVEGRVTPSADSDAITVTFYRLNYDRSKRESYISTNTYVGIAYTQQNVSVLCLKYEHFIFTYIRMRNIQGIIYTPYVGRCLF